MSSGSMSDRLERQFVGRLGQPDDDAVVAPHRLDRQVELVGQPAFDRHRPRGVDGRAERAEDAHPPVADLVAEALDDDRAVVRARRPSPRPVRRCTARGCSPRTHRANSAWSSRSIAAAGSRSRISRTNPPSAAAQLQRAARTIAVPERHLAGLARRRADRDALERDVLDAPGGRSQHERLARARLVDHLLVELAHTRAVGEEHTEQAAIGNRATGGDGQAASTRHGHGVDRSRGPTRGAGGVRRTPRSDSAPTAGRARW